MKDCAGWLSDVDVNLSSVVFAVSDEHGRDVADARVSANQHLLADHTDGRALTLDPGTYTFAFEAAGYARAQLTVTLRQSEKNRIVRLQLAPLTAAVPSPRQVAQASLHETPASVPRTDSAPSAVPVKTIILSGAALAALGTFSYFGLRGLSLRAQADHCTGNCRALIDEGKRDYVIADIGLGVAIAAAASAVLVYALAEAPAHAESDRALPPAAQERDATDRPPIDLEEF